MNEKEEISRLKQELESIRRRLFEMGKLTAMASLNAGILHQLSQPITAIHGFLKFMKKEMKETDKFYRPVVLMEEQSVFLKEMLEDLMSLIRHKEVKKEKMNVNDALRRSSKLLTDELRIRRIEWDLSLQDNLPLVYADNIQLQQVFMNIMVNAMEALSALPKGEKKLLKVSSKFDALARRVIILFEDSGPGIPLPAQREIFHPFYSTKTQGVGIGLAICRDIIVDHSGEITVESEEKKGTTFTIRLPAVS